MRNRGTWWIIILIMLMLDLYVFQVIKALASGASDRVRLTIYSIYWIISIAAIVVMVILPFVNYETWPKSIRTYLFATIVGLFFAKLIASVFFLLDDIRRLLMWLMGRIFPNFGPKFVDEGNVISRSAFLSWLGLGIGSTLFGTLVYGFSNKYNYQVRRVKLKFDNLPAGFRGTRIVHISDIHAGSFDNKAAVEKGISTIMKQNADLILFTGDMVNDRATEMENYKDVFNKLSAPLGVFSVLGNHDYGDYVNWESREQKAQNLANLAKLQQEMGWRLLMNEHVALEKNGDQIALLGIENWSMKGRFPKYGKMDKAYAGAEQYPFKILMSHDPSHWDGQVRPEYPQIDLMLSGHTHGMQFGLNNPYFKWSPVQWMYKQWAGLYEEGRQKLYVNPGFGFIGYPGRVGILPEITVLELV
ncbi:metallophosphoesterase [Aridibaculum aurantiacum]|uniref:metallophosphoesterase n=1 Tax=Aridibaculum aurantiacum TaxID=2810307 RepID=UPI001A95EAA4|nr:metallophosphoesterase [Aridibaculum aurantiacum]